MKLKTLKPRLATLDTRRAQTVASTARTRGSKWMAIRDLILRRDAGLCQPCMQAGRLTPAVQVDHKLPLAQGGTDDQSNLQAICAACHRRKSVDELAGL